MIKQSSGEDWTSTKISFSTATPSKGGAPPTIQANNIHVYRPPPPKRYLNDSVQLECASMKKRSSFISMPTISFGGSRSERLSRYSAPMQEVEEQKVSLHSNQFIQRFDTTRPATIPSDGTEHKVTSYSNKQTNKLFTHSDTTGSNHCDKPRTSSRTRVCP